MLTALKTFLYLILAAGLGAFYVPFVLLPKTPQVETGPFAYFAFTLWLLGAVIVLWCFGDFTVQGRGTPNPVDPPQALVTTGCYRYVRNPIYVAVLLIVLGHFLWFKSIWLLVYAVIVFVVCHLFVTLYEEPALGRKFGVGYESYCHSVPRWIPKLG
jgi:protein-S-isoprenylcysteine O-methyltransferase Ste14